MKRETLEGWFINILPDLNQNDEEAARYIIQNTLWWVGVTGLDAIRQDTWQYVPNSFWRRLDGGDKARIPANECGRRGARRRPGARRFLPGRQGPLRRHRLRLDTLFDFPLLFAMRRAFAEGKPVREVAQILAHDQLYPNPGVLVTFVGNHDLQRFMNEPGATIAGLNLAHTLIMTTRGTPQIYYGDEIAMAGGGDPDNRRDFPGGFPGDARNAFTAHGRTGRRAKSVRALPAARRLAPRA